MRSRLLVGAAVCCLVWPGPASAEEKPGDVIARALKASGEKQPGPKAVRITMKGTVEAGATLTVSQVVTWREPGHFKEVSDIEVQGQKVTATTAFDGTKAWVQVGGQTQDLDDDKTAEVKLAAYVGEVARLHTLTDKKYTLSLLGESKLADRPVVGVRVESKDRPDVSLYFDKATGLLAKVERRAKSPLTGEEVTEERLILDYGEKDGVKSPKKILIQHDGKKFYEAEVVSTEVLDKVDDSEFAKP